MKLRCNRSTAFMPLPRREQTSHQASKCRPSHETLLRAFVTILFAVIFICGESHAAAVNPATPVVTNNAAQAEIQGQQLAKRLRALQPAQSFTNDATLKIRGKDRRATVPLRIETTVTPADWRTAYVTDVTNGIRSFSVVHSAAKPNAYNLVPSTSNDHDRLTAPFAGSDFSAADLSAEFFHWPSQMLWKKEVKNSQACDVLESRPATVAPNGYSRIVSWIDQDTGGIVQAFAYDASGKLLKEFEVKEVHKVNGEWRVSELEIRNNQTKSSTVLVFHYDT